MKPISRSPSSRSYALVISDHAYRFLLRAYPAEFQQRYRSEMVQVFRTCCRVSYNYSGVSGVLLLWLPTLWDWTWSAAGEWFSSLFRKSIMKNIHTWRASNQLIPLLLFLVSFLILLVINPCSWLIDDSFFSGIETCALSINNQSGKNLRLTPIYTNHNFFSPVRLYRKGIPIFPFFEQRNISVKSGDQINLSYDCSNQGVS